MASVLSVLPESINNTCAAQVRRSRDLPILASSSLQINIGVMSEAAAMLERDGVVMMVDEVIKSNWRRQVLFGWNNRHDELADAIHD